MWRLAAAGLLLFPYPSPAAGGQRGKAIEAYQHSLRLRAELESRPQHARSAEDYLKLIRAFQDVYQFDPSYDKSPEALADAAQLREEMGWEFADKRYYSESIKAYEFLIAQYPELTVARDALFTIGEIYRVDLTESDEARRTFKKLLVQFPDSTKSRLAREKLKQIDQLEAAERPAPPVREATPQGAVPSVPEGPRAESSAASRETESPGTETHDLAEITGVHFWVGSNYTRVVIALRGEVKFSTSRLAHPDRLVFDLSGSRLSRALTGKTFPVEDGYLRQVRIAQYQPTVTRAVLDVKTITDYSVFSLPNPFRLVIDIHGPTPQTADRPGSSQNPPSQPAIEARVQPSTSGSVRGHDERPSRDPRTTLRAASDPPPAPSPSPGHATAAPEGRAAPSPVELTTEVIAPHPTAPPPAVEASDDLASAGDPDKPPVRTALPSSASGARTTAPVELSQSAKGESGKSDEPAARTLTRVLGLKIGRIVIDPGHGGHDTGTLGPHGLREKDLVLDVGLRLKALLDRKTDADVVMTRSDDTFVPLEERTAIANQKAADLFISIHANASRDSRARGIETYYLNFTSDPRALEVAARENASSSESVHELQGLVKKIVLTEKITESRDFAADVQRSVYTTLVKAGAREEDRGVKRAPFVVLIGANMPSILAEISFVTNPRDERLLKRAEHRQKIAEALYRGIQQYTRNLGSLRVAEKNQPEARPNPSLHRDTPAPVRTAQSIPAAMK